MKTILRNWHFFGTFFKKNQKKTLDKLWGMRYNINIRLVKTLNKQARGRKEKQMDGMTNEQFKIALEMIIKIIEKSKDKEDAIKQIKELLNK